MVDAGMLIADRYRLVEQLARGGMGTVWRAQDQRLQRSVAVKLLHAPTGPDAEVAAERAMREARITARLHHPHAVPVFDVVEHEGRPCLVMQYLPSRSLQAVLDDEGALPAARVARLGAELAGALAAAHRAGIIHRDVKPANVLVTDDGSAKLTDFGISHALGDASLTSVGMVTGTPAYLAPEVARGASAGFASDVFSLGSTLYRAVEGVPPFGPVDNAMAVLHRVAAGRFTPPSPDGPLTPLLLQLLDADPAKRPPMHNVALTLRGLADARAPRVVSAPPRPAPAPTRATTRPTALGPPPPVAPPGPTPPRSVGPPRPVGPSAAPPDGGSPRRRAAWIAAAVLAVLLVVGVVVGIDRWSGDTSGDRAGASATPPASAAGTTPTDPASSADDATPPDQATTVDGSPTDPGTPTPQGDPTADELTAALTSYYAALPGDTDTGWSRLTASYQADPSGGRAGYDEFWGGIASVAVSDVVATPPGTVVATLAYVFTDGSTSTERTSFGLVEQDGVLKIDTSQVVDS